VLEDLTEAGTRTDGGTKRLEAPGGDRRLEKGVGGDGAGTADGESLG